ncbi:Vacuolar iron transporter 1 [Elsinoe australis]|uniref:Vacuolar iron transporter 1 n=1 Tax=Elsinoe australis TaxID=40998 RepID=A0A2P7YGE4_9PEZI|nr:Vacuolar iron transporter 1 [Elsinoe australis]
MATPNEPPSLHTTHYPNKASSPSSLSSIAGSSFLALSSSAPSSVPTNPTPSGHGFTLRDPVLLRDAIIGFSDGLTVPFALTAGLSSLGSSRLVILGGLAELFAGAISMGLGTILASITERKRYQIVEAKERERWRGEKGVSVSEEKSTVALNGEDLSATSDGHLFPGGGLDGELDGAAGEGRGNVFGSEAMVSAKEGSEHAEQIRQGSDFTDPPVSMLVQTKRPEKEVRGIFDEYGVRTRDVRRLAWRLSSDEGM